MLYTLCDDVRQTVRQSLMSVMHTPELPTIVEADSTSPYTNRPPKGNQDDNDVRDRKLKSLL